MQLPGYNDAEQRKNKWALKQKVKAANHHKVTSRNNADEAWSRGCAINEEWYHWDTLPEDLDLTDKKCERSTEDVPYNWERIIFLPSLLKLLCISDIL